MMVHVNIDHFDDLRSGYHYFSDIAGVCLIVRGDKPASLHLERRDPPVKNLGRLRISDEPTIPTRDGALLTVLPTDNIGLRVWIYSTPLMQMPTAVSFAMEPRNGLEAPLIVLQYPERSGIDEWKINKEFTKRFPLQVRFGEHPKKIAWDSPGGVRVLMINEDVNIREIIRDRADIIKGQRFVVGTPSIVARWDMALLHGASYR